MCADDVMYERQTGARSARGTITPTVVPPIQGSPSPLGPQQGARHSSSRLFKSMADGRPVWPCPTSPHPFSLQGACGEEGDAVQQGEFCTQRLSVWRIWNGGPWSKLGTHFREQAFLWAG